jgi:uncharacterized membrane protein (DUF4010 family)
VQQALFERLAVALAIGFLVGAERGWQAREVAEGGRAAGLRTFSLIGLLGGVSGLLARLAGGWALAAMALPLAAAVIVFQLKEAEELDDHSATGVVAALLVFALGALAVMGDWRLASAAAVAATALLATKRVLHAWLKALTWEELRSAIVLLAMSFVVLPLLPDRGYGPFGAVNPYELWSLTIAIAGVTFLAYVAIRVLGVERGLFMAAAAGSLVSSTAVVLDLSRRVHASPRDASAGAGAGLLAGAVMATRMGVIAGVMAPSLLPRLAPPLAAFALVSLAAAYLVARLGAAAEELQPGGARSPFDLRSVVKFALVLGLIIAAARIVEGLYGTQDLPLVGAVAGLVDVDALTLAVGQMTLKGLDPGIGALAVLSAGAVNTASKAAIALIVGGRRFGGLVGAGSALAAAAGAAAFLLAPALG